MYSRLHNSINCNGWHTLLAIYLLNLLSQSAIIFVYNNLVDFVFLCFELHLIFYIIFLNSCWENRIDLWIETTFVENYSAIYRPLSNIIQTCSVVCRRVWTCFCVWKEPVPEILVHVWNVSHIVIMYDINCVTSPVNTYTDFQERLIIYQWSSRRLIAK